MPTQNEIRVMDVLSGIEIPAAAGPAIREWGNEAVTVLCEAALGSYAGLRPKMRTNAVALLGSVDHPQAVETIQILLSDPDSDVSIRAMRAAGQQKNAGAVTKLAALLKRRDLPALIAAEAVNALAAVDSPQARSALRTYADASPDDLPHRRSPLVGDYLHQAGY